MFEFFVNLAKALNPRVSDTPEQIYAWRQTVVFAVVLSLAIHIVHLAHVYGGLQWVGVSGFARASDVVEVQNYFREARLLQIEEQIDRVRIRQCSAYKTSNQAAMVDTNSELNRLGRMYRSVAGFDYRIKSCDELLAP